MTPQVRLLVAKICDVILVILALAWLHAELAGGSRWRVGPIILSNRSSYRILAELLGLLVIRHVVLPTPTVWARVTGAVGRRWHWWTAERQTPRLWIDRRRTTHVIIAAVLVTRVLVLGAGYLGTTNSSLTGDPVRDVQLEEAKAHALEYLNGRWDSGWYARIALTGYEWDASRPASMQNVAFFPAFPLAIRFGVSIADWVTGMVGVPELLGRERGVRTEVVGALVSIGFFILALVLLGRMATLDLGAAFANRAVLIASVAPFSYFFSCSYTESLFLLSILGAFLCQRQGRAGWCIAFGLLAGLTKQTGFLLAIPLALHLAIRPRPLRARSQVLQLLGVIAPVVGAGAYCLYLWWQFGDPLAWVRAQEAWAPVERWRHIAALGSLASFMHYYPYEAVNLLAVLVVLPWIWRSRLLHPAYVVFGAMAIIVPLALDVAPLARMTVPVFPIYLALAERFTGRWSFALLCVVLLGLQMVAASQFYSWRPLY